MLYDKIRRWSVCFHDISFAKQKYALAMGTNPSLFSIKAITRRMLL